MKLYGNNLVWLFRKVGILLQTIFLSCFMTWCFNSVFEVVGRVGLTVNNAVGDCGKSSTTTIQGCYRDQAEAIKSDDILTPSH